MPEFESNKKQGKGNPEKEMTFWEHLEELRGMLIRSVLAIVILGVAAFIKRDFIFDEIVLAPTSSDFFTNRLLCRLGEFLSIKSLCMDDFSLKLVNINMSGQFITHLYVSIVAAIVVAFPYLIHEVWRFIRPALLPKEKKYSRGAVIVSSLLFLIGILFSYFLIVPLTINFFGSYQVSADVPNTIALGSYISTVVSVTIACGIVFELPIFVYFFSKVGIITPAFLKRNRKYTLIILLTVAAIITPPDVFSQILVTLPLMLLYELSIMVSANVQRNREKDEASDLAG
jgi:sec-independent protein translocase protein TatC